jgi:hypothetical protein
MAGRVAHARLGLLAGLLMSCVPEPPGLDGRACDDAHPCGDGYSCVDDPCGVSSQPNLLSNGDFESTVDPWSPYSNTLADVQDVVRRSGQKAARLRSEPGSTSSFFGMQSKGTQVVVELGKTYCTEAWVNRGNVQDRINLTTRRWATNGDWEDVEVAPVPVDGGWVRVGGRIALTTQFEKTITVRVSSPTPATSAPSGEYFTDDVRIWEDAGKVCRRL